MKFNLFKKKTEVSKPGARTIFPNFGNEISPLDKSYSTLCANYKGWVFTCINKKAMTVACTPLKLKAYRQNKQYIKGNHLKSYLQTYKNKYERTRYLKEMKVEEIELFEHPFLDLMTRPNPIMTRFEFWVNLVIRLELAGYCGVYVVKHPILGTPVELWPLPLRKEATLNVIPDREKIIGGYIYRDGNIQVTFKPDEIVVFKYPNPDSVYEGLSKIITQEYPYNIDIYLDQQQYNLLRNKATFGNVFETDARLHKEAVDALISDIDGQFGGVLSTGKPLVLHSGLHLRDSKLTLTSKDLAFKEMSELASEKIISAFDTSKGKLGIVTDVNRANAEALDETYYKEGIKPTCLLIEEVFESFILPLYDEKITCDFELPTFNNREMDLHEDSEYLSRGVYTINEVRARKGDEPVEWGELPWMPFSLTQYGSTSDATDNAIKLYNKALDKNVIWKQFYASLMKKEKLLSPVLQAHFKNQLKNLLEKLEGRKSLNLYDNLIGFSRIKRREVLAKGKLDDLNINIFDETKKLIDLQRPVFFTIIQQTAEEKLEAQKIITGLLDLEFSANTNVVQTWLGNRLVEYSKQITGVTHKEVNIILGEGFQEGISITEIADRLKAKFESYDKHRALMIARTESVDAVNFADLQVIKQNDLEALLLKFWVNEPDARDSHQQAGVIYNEENAIEIDAYFEVGDDKMLHPGGGSLAKENVNCRCTLGYVKRS